VVTQIAYSVPDEAQTSDVVIAYEPVWAIGTGLTPQLDDIRSMHFAIRNQLMSRFPDKGAAIQVLYGGSLKPSNAAEILALPNVDGGLVGGASLRADELFAITVA
jgi:triosephosphate isomerase